MGKYLHYFLTKGEFAKKYFSEDYEKHWTSLTVAGHKSNYDKTRKKLAKTPLTLVPLTDNSTTFTFVIGTTVNTDTLQSISYSIDGGQTWTTTNNTDGTAVNVAVTVTDRQPVMWKGVGKAISVSDSVYSRITSNRNFAAFGNPLSLLSERYNLTDLYPFPWALANLFRGNTYLIYASDLMLTPRRCGSYCYQRMFDGCSNLETYPELPATRMWYSCYRYMFQGCSKMITPPTLPSTKLAQYCYCNMFQSCSKLTSLPTLPATNLAEYCYCSMFRSCTSLTNPTIVLPSTAMASYCYESMFYGCSNLTTIPVLSHVTMVAPQCYQYMFYGCSKITTAPILPVTKMETSCYYAMFQGCTSLTTAPILPATSLKANCYQNMFQGCTSLTACPTLPATTLPANCYYNMFNGCTSITTMPDLPATTITGAAVYRGMFAGCTSLVNVVDILPAETLSQSNVYYDMFNGCTSMTTAPKLPAKATTSSCYYRMFNGCTSLNKITAIFDTVPNTSSSTNAWVTNVAATGTFIMSGTAEWDPEDYRGVNGIPEGWTVQYITPTLVTGDEKTNYAVPSNGVDIEIGGYDLLTNPSVTLVDSDNVFTMTPGLGNTDEWEAWEWMTSPHAHGNDFTVTCSDYSELHTATIVVSSISTSDLIIRLVNNAEALPNTYRRVAYVESDGNQQVDLNLDMFGTVPVDYGVQLIGYISSTSGAYGTLLANLSETSPYPGTGVRRDNATNNVQYRANNTNTTITTMNNIFCINYTGTVTTAFNCKTTLFAAINTSDSSWFRFVNGRIYACKIIMNNVVVRNLIPCVEIATDIAGLYDTVNNVFYTSETDPLLYAI